MQEITWKDFERVELRVGTVIGIEDSPKARKPAYKLKVDFGNEIGVLQSSAQITVHYTKEELLGKQVVAVVNFPKKQIAKFMSECLVVGAVKEGDVFLLRPEIRVINGSTVA